MIRSRGSPPSPSEASAEMSTVPPGWLWMIALPTRLVRTWRSPDGRTWTRVPGWTVLVTVTRWPGPASGASG